MNVAAIYLKELVKCAASTEVDAATNDAILWANETIQRMEEASGAVANLSILLSMLKFDKVESNAVALSYMTGGGSAMLTVSDLEAINKTMLPSGEMTHIEQCLLLESRKGVSLLIGLLKARQRENHYYLGEEDYYINERIEALQNRHKELTECQKEVDELQDWRPEDFTIEFVEVPDANSGE